MIRALRIQPYFTLLLPVFFVIHGYAEHFGFISVDDVALLALTYCLFTTAIYVFSILFFRNRIKAGLITASWIAVFLFFGAFHDFMKMHSPVRFFYKYSVLLSVLLAVLILLFIFLKKTKYSFHRLTLFLNILLLVYLVVDIVTIGWKSLNPPENKLANYDFAKDAQFRISDSCSRPDIYLLLFDEYASSQSLKERFGFENDLDSFLVENKFNVQSRSTGNYNQTPFSMAALLNMRYIQGLDYSRQLNRNEYLDCNILIRENQVIKFLGMNGYDMVNLSIFDLAGHPSPLSQTILPVKTRMITEGTLFPRLYRDFEWFFAKHRLFMEDHFFRHADNNRKVLQDLYEISAQKPERPRFIYAHLYMPHWPYFFDRDGNRKADTTILREFHEYDITAYLDYVRYTNQEMKKLIDTIMKNSGRQAVIMVLSDHGFRRRDKGTDYLFQNLNAVYFPNHNYDKLYDSISNVNLFPVVFNSLFRQNFQLVNDTTYYLRSGNN